MKSKWLKELTWFQGIIGADDHQLPIRFGAHIDLAGEVVFTFDRICFDDKSRFIFDIWHKERRHPHWFSLTGEAEDGTEFKTKSLSFDSIGPHSDVVNGCYLVLVGNCAEATFTRQLEKPVDAAFIKTHLKGFKSFPSNHKQCELGMVAIAGMSEFDNPDQVTGYIAIQAESKRDNLDIWRSDVEKLIEHIRRILSFSSGTNLRQPVTEFYHDNIVEIFCYSQVEQRKDAFPVFHFLNHGPILEVAINSHFHPPIEAKSLFFIIEWLSMNATYNEFRLVAGMTALENLIDSNATEDEAFFFPEADFEKIKKALRRAVRETTTERLPSYSMDDFNKHLPGKINELNRRPLREKIFLLADRWGVVLDGITEKMIGDAISARNYIIHRGSYYEDGLEKVPLIEHAIVIREIGLRFVMTAIGYKGEYISLLGQYHFAKYPPTPPA
ncbi:hypothetical protein M2352_003498 [Azospirillum fermentarium]|uniref:hypothetical protein n=1 Tax=Azospirillum fermentarium TaxID=1233114 RepID=UPI0022269ACF|nr:hypothetical protein [Azospirillum fermentarium]MCW2247864.1 hypothetical protein [Azospirillum fermentarium]